MSAFFRRKPTFFPVAITALAVVLCTGLGIWQLYRMEWKAEIKETIASRIGQEAKPLPMTIDDPAVWDYQAVTLSGTFRNDQETYLQAQSANGNFGYQIITPLERADGTTVLVNRGWVPFEMREPSTRTEGIIEGPVTINGIARLGWNHTWIAENFVLDNDPVKKIFFEAELQEMADAHQIDVLPIFVEVDETPVPGGWPKGGQTVVELVDNHLIYAIQWFALAIAGLAIFIIYHRRPEA